MKLMWGADDIGEMNATRIAPQYRKVLDVRFRPWAVDVVYTADTFFRVAGQAACKTKMDAIEVALKADGKDLLFLNDDASNSNNSVLNADTLGGTRCVGWEWLGEPRGAQFTTSRFLRAVFEYRVRYPSMTTRLSDFSETVEVNNPPPRYIGNEAVNGVIPEVLLTVALPLNTGSQSGFAVGVQAYPTPPVDCFTTAGVGTVRKIADVVRYTTPKYRGAATEEYRVDWRREFICSTPLVATMNPWPAGG